MLKMFDWWWGDPSFSPSTTTNSLDDFGPLFLFQPRLPHRTVVARKMRSVSDIYATFSSEQKA